MRLAVTIGRRNSKWSVISDPSEDVSAHSELFKRFKIGNGTVKGEFYNEIRVIGNGIDKRSRFLTKDEQAAIAKSTAEQNKTFLAAEAERKAAADAGISVDELRKQNKTKAPAESTAAVESESKKGKKKHES